MKENDSVLTYSLELETLYKRARPDASFQDQQKDLAKIFLLGIPTSLFEFCHIYPKPKTLEKAVKQVTNYEKGWRSSASKQPMMNAASAGAQQAPSQGSYNNYNNGQQQV